MSRSIAEHHWRRAREIAQGRELQSVFDMQLLWESVINHFELSNCLYQCGRYEIELDDRENPSEDRKIPGDQLSRWVQTAGSLRCLQRYPELHQADQ